MSRECDCCGKTKMAANQVHRQSQWVQRRTSSPKEVNLQTVRVTDDNGNSKKLKLCTRCIKKMKSEAK